MTPQFFYILINSLLIVFTLNLFIQTFKKRKDRKALFFAIGVLHQAIWNFSFVMAISSETLEAKLFWDNWINWGMLGFLIFYIAFTFCFFGYSYEKYRLRYILGIAIGALLYLPVFIWGDHPLMRSDIRLDVNDPFFIIRYANGIYLWSIIFLGYALVGFLIILYWRFIIVTKNSTQKRQAGVILSALLIPTIVSLLGTFGGNFNLLSRLVNTLVFAFVITSFLIYYTVFGLRTFDFLPLATNLILENIGDGAAVFDEKLHLIEINESLLHILGYKEKKDLLYQNVRDIFEHWEDVRSVDKIPDNSTIESEYLDENIVKYFQIKKTEIKSKTQKFQGFILVFRDITANKMRESHLIQSREELEEKYRHSQKMESVGRLAGGISHDFNNILTTIIGNIQLLLSDKSPEDPEIENLTDMMLAAENASKLTKQLLAFSRKQVLKPEMFNLNWLIGRIEKILTRTLGEQIELEIQLDGELPNVLADTGAMDQVILNLAVNARDAMPKGGKLRIKTIRWKDLAAHEYALLTISDNGIGMDEEVQSHLFEPYYTTKSIGKGTGLGLATVFGTISQFDGLIDVASVSGEGTTFKIYLPAASPLYHMKMPEIQTEIPPGHNEMIILVEDDDKVRKITWGMLRKLGYNPIVYSSGEELLENLKEMPDIIDLLFTDVILTGMNGKELYDRMKEKYPGLKVLFGSGYTNNVLTDFGISDDSFHFLTKPYKLDKLSEEIENAIYSRGK